MLDSKPPSIPLRDYAYNEDRFRQLGQSQPEDAARLLEQAQQDIFLTWARYEALAAQPAAASVPPAAPPHANGKVAEARA